MASDYSKVFAVPIPPPIGGFWMYEERGEPRVTFLKMLTHQSERRLTEGTEDKLKQACNAVKYMSELVYAIQMLCHLSKTRFIVP